MSHKYLTFDQTGKMVGEVVDKIKENRNKIADMDTEIGLLKHDVKILKSVLVVTMLLIVLLIIGVIMPLIPAKAATLKGDEHLGGFMYMMECIEKDDIPPEYQKLLDKWHPVYTVTEEEYEALCRIVQAEIGSGDKVQKANVASCVMARVESPSWPNDILGVIFDHKGSVWQFSPLGDGNYYKVKITDSTREAVNEVLNFGKLHDCLWFCSDSSYRKEKSYHRLNHTWVFYDGEHHYFYD